VLALLHARLVYALTLQLRAELHASVREMVAADGGGGGGDAVAAAAAGGEAGGGGGGSSGAAGAGAGGAGGGAGGAPPPFLHPEFADVLSNGARYEAEVRGGAVARGALLSGVVVDAYVDFWRLRGADAAPRVPQLAQMLARYHLPAADGAARGSEVAAVFALTPPDAEAVAGAL